MKVERRENVKKDIRLTDIDLVTYLKYNGYTYKTAVEGDKVVFIFEDDGNITKLIEEYPTSEVNRILSIYHGLYKSARSLVRNR